MICRTRIGFPSGTPSRFRSGLLSCEFGTRNTPQLRQIKLLNNAGLKVTLPRTCEWKQQKILTGCAHCSPRKRFSGIFRVPRLSNKCPALRLGSLVSPDASDPALAPAEGSQPLPYTISRFFITPIFHDYGWQALC
jgi:hypothetical protein